MGVLKKTSTFSHKISSIDQKFVEKAKLSKFWRFRRLRANSNKNQLVRFWNTHNLTKNHTGVWCLLEGFTSEMAWHYSKSVKHFHQSSMRFHSAMATLELKIMSLLEQLGRKVSCWTAGVLLELKCNVKHKTAVQLKSDHMFTREKTYLFQTCFSCCFKLFYTTFFWKRCLIHTRPVFVLLDQFFIFPPYFIRFFNKLCQAPILYLTLRVLPI